MSGERSHRANSLPALDAIALDSIRHLKPKCDQVINSMKKLFIQFNETQGDLERAYIVGKRYLFVAEFLFKTTDDQKYTELRYRSEYNKVYAKVLELREILTKQYEEMATPREQAGDKNILKHMEPKPEGPKLNIVGEFVSCKDLYEAIEAKLANMLIIDIRSIEEYSLSSINCVTCINIPNHVISAGLSANTLGEKLEAGVKEIWEKRDTFDYIVLLDRNTSSETIHSSKLEMLRSCMVEWDFNRHYKRSPAYLSGGFREFLETYPTSVTNAHALLAMKNNDLDELLDIDDVVYPTEDSPQMANHKNIVRRIVKESLIDMFFNLEEDSGATVEQSQPIAEVVVPKQPLSEAVLPPQELAAVDEEIRKSMEEEREKMLREARSKKPKPAPTVPVINRSSKPKEIVRTTGRTGLKNIKNTCYLNTMVQCLRMVPYIKTLFTNKRYTRYVTCEKPKIMEELACVIEQLWTQDGGYLIPTDFCNKLGKLEATVARGTHEDAMEVFLLLFHHIHDDCAHPFEMPDVMTPKFEAKLAQLSKNSIFVDLFYHQVRDYRYCTNCKSSSFTFEMDNTLMLPINPSGNDLSVLLKDYFRDYLILDFCCSKCKKGVRNAREMVETPRILVCILKRYQLKDKNDLNSDYIKNESEVSFDEVFKLKNTVYRLYSCALHVGSLKGGHYTAAGCIDNTWYEFNDERVLQFDLRSADTRKRVSAFFYAKEN